MRRWVGVVCGIGLWLSGCQTTPEPNLYQQLGGQTGLEHLVDGLLQHIAADDKIVHHFKDTDIERFRSKLIEQLCAVSDGPCHYTGASMQESHTGFHISQADFDRLVQHLIDTMNELRIPIASQNALLARLAPMYHDVTYR